MIVPIIISIIKKGRKPLSLFLVALLVIIGTRFKRILIVVPSPLHPLFPTSRLDESWLDYFLTVPE
jgi:molybdopterin-containing oxidoreductase family membrane subunit